MCRTSHFCFRLLLVIASFSCLFCSSFTQAAANQDPIRDEIAGFIQVLTKDHPTLADYQAYFGYNDNYELAFEWKACEAKGQSPALQVQDCYQSILTNWSKKDTSPSLFMAWLKTQVPTKGKMTKPSMRRIGQDKDSIHGQRIQVRLDDVSVDFWRSDGEPDRVAYGKLAVKEINGIPLDVLVQREGNASVLSAMGLTSLLRPLTADEEKNMQAKMQKQCAANPECARQMAEQEKEQQEHKKQDAIREKIAKAYDSWCNSNKDDCTKQKNERKKLFEQRTEIAEKCEKDYQQCLPVVEKWMSDSQAQMKRFCTEYPQNCSDLEALRQKQEQEQETWCNAKPELCAKTLKPIDKAVLEIRKKQSSKT